MGYRSAVVWVLEENRRARRFYEKYGFSSEGVYQQIEDWDQALGDALCQNTMKKSDFRNDCIKHYAG